MREDTVVFGVDGLQRLIDLLVARGFDPIGPTVRDGAVVTGSVRTLDDLPAGVGDTQEPGRYRLTETGSASYFGFTTTALSWKPYLFPAHRLLWRADDAGVPQPARAEIPRLALIGVRSCDLHAVAVQDRVFAERDAVDPDYVARRAALFIVTVACARPGGTCFCASMGTGPRAEPGTGYDLAMTEVLDEAGHRFVATAGSDRGAELLADLAAGPAPADDLRAADRVTDAARESMGRVLDVSDIRDLLYDNAEHPRWDDVAGRCLSCTNCTLVCPTCFCATPEDTADLHGAVSRSLTWDSCFSSGHSYLHGGPVRSTTRDRYRQWLTHKFGSWIDQFGTSGCVGCGRCITFCPVGIDVTEELTAIRATSAGGAP